MRKAEKLAPRPAKVSADPISPSAIVGIGASAGGLEACKGLLKGWSTEQSFGMVLVVHLDPDHESIMAELLGKDSTMTVVQACDGDRVEANHLYVVPPKMRLAFANGVLQLRPLKADERRNPIDLFFKTLAADLHERAIGVILSGNGSDGTFGLRAIKEAGGLTIVQDPESAAYDGMPRSALANSPVDRCLSVASMPGFLSEYIARLDEFESRPPEQDVEKFRLEICQRLQRQLHHDFSQYKKSTMMRRTHRRMLVVGASSLASYLKLLDEDPDEAPSLLRELLISVTRFFRDPQAFHSLIPTIRRLVEQKEPGEKLRIWVPACATGEEAYTLAMLVVEEFERAGKPVSAQIFATEIDAEALRKARSGRYPEAISSDIEEDRLHRFFTFRGDRYEVIKTLRAMCLFSLHNVVGDPPFSHIDLVSCRNLLIYLEPELQDRVLAVLHYSLEPGGILFLGTAETIADNRKLFGTVDKVQRIFEAQECKKRPQVFPFSAGGYPPRPPIEAHIGHSGRGLETANHLSRFVLPRLDITVLLIDDQDRIQDSCGHPDRYLRIRPGPVDDSLFTLLRKEWVSSLRVALHQCRREQKEVLVSDKILSGNDETRRLEVRVCPYQLVAGQLVEGWLLIFQEFALSEDAQGKLAGSPLGGTPLSNSVIVDQLENELDSTRQRLRAITEELETYNEELRSTNEELMSMNEELQSSNEELESSREEIQSVNQELYAVNGELNTSISERDTANSDLLHLFSSNPNPTIFLDKKLRIRQFTPSSTEVYHLLPTDLGRPLADIRSRLSEWDLLAHCRTVTGSLESHETILTRRDPGSPDRSYQGRILPYLNLDRVLDGVVLSFVEITELQQAKEQTERREHQLSTVARLGSLISGERNLEWLFSQALLKVCRVLSVQVACLMRYSQAGHTFEMISERGVQSGDLTILANHKQVQETVRSGLTATFAEGVIGSNASDPGGLRPPKITSGIITVVPEDQEFIWLLGAFDREERRFTFDEVDFLESLAYLLGTALARSQEHFVNALNRVVAGTLAKSRDFIASVPDLLRTMGDELGASCCEIWLAKPGSDTLLHYMSLDELGRSGPPLPGRRITEELILPDGLPLLGSVWENRLPAWVGEHRSESDTRSGYTDARYNSLTGFALPLLSGEERLGVLSCFFPRQLFSSERLMASLKVAGLSLGELAQRTRAEQALRASEKSLYQALKAVPFPLCIVDEDGTVLLTSDITYELTGCSPEDLANVTQWSEQIFHNELQAEKILTAVKRSTAGAEVLQHGIREVYTLNGKCLWDFTTVPLAHLPVGRRTLVAVAYDVTEQIHSREHLEEVARHKDTFLAMLGHELRNPLAAIRNGVQLMSMGDCDEDREQALGVIDRQSSQMALLIDGLLDMNRIALGKVSLDSRPLCLSELITTVVDDKRTLFEAKGLTLVFEAPAKPVWVLGDRVRLVQVIDNLLGNSLKFTEAPGSATVSLGIDDGHDVVLHFRDTGQGMTPELAAVVFEPFRQGEQTLARSHGGLGLGLSLVRQIVELHQGTVTLSSDGPGLGCEFEVHLLGCAADVEDPGQEDSLERAAWSILLVEDDLDLAMSLGRLLEMRGHEVRHAFDGRLALELAEARTPEIILCDLGLPGDIDGFRLLRKFRKIEALRSVPVVAVTGYGLTADKDRSAQAGFDAHLTKPFEVLDVERLLSRLSRPSQTLQLPRPDFCRVLVVDDNIMIAQVTAKLLQKAGYEARYATSASEALRIAGEQHPHLALLDLHLPEMNGIELKEKLVDSTGTRDCIFLALTGSDEAEDFALTSKAGFAAHLVKPVGFERLLREFERVAAVLHR